MTKRSGKNEKSRPSYVAQRLERPEIDEAATNKTVFHRADQLEYLEGGSREPTPASGTQRGTGRSMLGRTGRTEDFSASVDQYTSQDNFDPLRTVTSFRTTQ